MREVVKEDSQVERREKKMVNCTLTHMKSDMVKSLQLTPTTSKQYQALITSQPKKLVLHKKIKHLENDIGREENLKTKKKETQDGR